MNRDTAELPAIIADLDSNVATIQSSLYVFVVFTLKLVWLKHFFPVIS